MTVGELAKQPDFAAVNLPCADREILGGYAGDLLSWVMGRASEGDAWVTIMSNINVVAVASLADVACVIFSESVDPDEDALVKAQKEQLAAKETGDGAVYSAIVLALAIPALAATLFLRRKKRI